VCIVSDLWCSREGFCCYWGDAVVAALVWLVICVSGGDEDHS